MARLVQTQELFTLGPASNKYGNIVAIGGSYLAVADTQLSGGNQIGQVDIYHLVGSTWIFIQSLNSPASANNDTYGVRMALSPDGTMLFVAQPLEAGTRGSVFFYLLTAGVFLLTQTLQGTDGAVSDGFGLSVGISAAGNLVIGAPISLITGNVYYYTLIAGVWTLAAGGKFHAADSTGGFGGNGIYTAGTWLLVGGNHAGGFGWYFFQLIAGAWTQMQEIAPGAGFSFASHGAFMTQTALTAVIGGFSTGPPFVEIARIYVLSGGVWTFQQILTHALDAAGDGEDFATPLTIAGDDSSLVIGADQATYAGGNPGNGKAYVYTLSGGVWGLIQTLLPDPAFTADEPFFGTVVAALPGLAWVIVGVFPLVNGADSPVYLYAGSSINITLGLKGMKIYHRPQGV